MWTFDESKSKMNNNALRTVTNGKGTDHYQYVECFLENLYIFKIQKNVSAIYLDNVYTFVSMKVAYHSQKPLGQLYSIIYCKYTTIVLVPMES